MQVRKIQGVNTEVRNNSTSFGYNHEVNQQLIKTLASHKHSKNKAIYQYLRRLVISTNKAEDDLRKAEANNQTELANSLKYVFLTTKLLLVDIINTLFPSLNYREKETESYIDEVDFEKDPNHWTAFLAATMDEHEVQEQTAGAVNELLSNLKQKYPKANLAVTGLSEAVRQKIIEDSTDIADEFDDDIEDAMELQQKIELGKSKVYHFEPTTKEELQGFASLGGMQKLKDILNKEIVTPLKDTKQAKYNEEHYGIKMPNGILFYGPPGTGKTTIVERLAVEAGLPLLELTPDSYGSEYVSGNDINIGAVFDYAASIATEEKPVILLIDDIDGIIGSRTSGMMQSHENSKLNVLLRRIQNAQKNHIIVMAATNNYDGIDKAALRRLRQQYYVGLPDLENRKAIIKLLLESTDNGQKIANDTEAINKIAELTESFPISALEDIITDARKIAHTDFYHTREIVLDDLITSFQKPETQNKKINEDLYKTKATRKSIGFGK